MVVFHAAVSEKSMSKEKKKQLMICWVVVMGFCINLLLLSCGDSVGGNGKSQVYLSAQASSDAYKVESDVYDSSVSGNVSTDKISVVLKSIYKDPTEATQTNLADILLKSYQVTYFRIDGNSNVPEGFQDSLANNLVPNGSELELPIDIVRSTAKLKSPLEELAFGGGEGIIYMNAMVKFYGEDLAGNAVASDEITIPIEAKDW